MSSFDPGDIPVANEYSRDDFGTPDEVRGWNLCRDYVIEMVSEGPTATPNDGGSAHEVVAGLVGPKGPGLLGDAAVRSAVHRPGRAADGSLHLDTPRPADFVTEYAVLCRRDGEIRDIGTPDPAKAAAWAASRDEECGTCYAEHNPHVVVSRTRTAWTPTDDARPLPLHRTEAGYPRCSSCDGGGCLDCTDPA